MTYHVTVERDGRFWLVTIDGVGMTQARNLDEVDEMARDYISLAEEVDEDSIALDVIIQIPDEVRGLLEHVEQLRSEAAQAQSEAADQTRQAARELASTGMTFKDLGQILGVSRQRAQQLVKG